MKQLKLETETIQVSIYCEIIHDILSKHQQLSINKILVFSYLIKKNYYIPNNVYNGNNKQDIIYKCISLLAGDYIEYCNNIQFIIKAIHLLNTKGLIYVKNDNLHIFNELKKNKPIYELSIFMQSAINASNKMTDRQFMREVTNNV
ncbi:hypothetical protein [Paenibacillus sp. OK076]|uniref:hypothetical protein n=1 Tax=Paenibacillus sp. OK076 TaxID=1884379 RepID=UPI0008C9C8EE|nr:hypothetical protein [Paenibacillus sp. OK076]SEO05688.1 hypothetical protein SAMN05518670_3493 [Paenibacillus sp. OK076]